MVKLRDILVLLGIGLAGYFMLKHIKAEAKPVEKTESEKQLQSVRTQYETEKAKTQTKEEREAEAWRQYTEHQIACNQLLEDFRKDCMARGGGIIQAEALHMLNTSYQVLDEKIICNQKWYCVIFTHTIYEEQKRYGAPTVQPQPARPRFE